MALADVECIGELTGIKVFLPGHWEVEMRLLRADRMEQVQHGLIHLWGSSISSFDHIVSRVPAPLNS